MLLTLGLGVGMVLKLTELKVGQQVRVAGTSEYPRFFNVPGSQKDGVVAQGLIGEVVKLYEPVVSDHLDRSDGRDVLIAFTEPKPWKAHFEPCELELPSAAPIVPDELDYDQPADIEYCVVDRGSPCEMVGDYMTPLENALILSPAMSMTEAAKLLYDAKVTGAPVTCEGKLVGVLTQFDFLYTETLDSEMQGAGLSVPLDSGSWETHVRKSLASTVKTAMSRPLAIDSRADMQQVAQLMLKRRFNHVPVVESDGSLVGTLTSQNVLRHVILRMGGGEPCDAL